MFWRNKDGKPIGNLLVNIVADHYSGGCRVAYDVAHNLLGGGKRVSSFGVVGGEVDKGLPFKEAVLYVAENVENLVNLDLVLNYRDQSIVDKMPRVFLEIDGEQYFIHAESENVVLAGYSKLFSEQ